MVNPFAPFQPLIRAPQGRAGRLALAGVYPPARALLSAFLIQAAPGRPALCVAPDWKRAERFAEELSFFFSLLRFSNREDPTRREVLRYPPGLPEPPALAQASWAPVQDRLRVLITTLALGFSGVVVTSQEALREKAPPRDALERCMRSLGVGDEIERETLAALLQEAGYRRAAVVEAPGDFAVRGSLIDFYPLTAQMPYRVDFLGDRIDGIRTFEPESQRSQDAVTSAAITPASLFLSGSVNGQGLRQRVKERADALNVPARQRLELVERIEIGLPAYEIPIHLPFFYPKLDSLLDFLPRDTLVLVLGTEESRRQALAHYQDCAESLERLAAKGRIVPRAEDLYFDPDALRQSLQDVDFVSFPDLVRGETRSGTGAEPMVPRGGGNAGASSAAVERSFEPLPDPQADLGDGTPDPNGAGAGRRGTPSTVPAPNAEARIASPSGKGDPHGAETFPAEEILDLRATFRSLGAALLPGPEEKKTRGLAGFVRLIQGWIGQGMRVFLVCGSEPEKVRLGRLLHEYDLSFRHPEEKVPVGDGPADLYLLRGDLSQGFLFPEGRMVFLHEEDIFGKKVRKPRPHEKAEGPGIDLTQLKPGDHVVHIDFGIGLFLGLETLNIRGYINDYLALLYHNNDRLYLPVDRASRIQKYVSTEDLPPSLDKLGGTAWTRTKSRVKESVLAMAQELVSLYAVRLVKQGHAFSKPDPSYEEFEAAFPYEETPDQMRAIEQVLQDMEGDRSMDRLVCGDVGYGKTEVAIRAAYKAVMDGKQVAVLVPTTVLAQQHYGSFRNRFSGYPVEVEMLSRFRAQGEQRTILERLAEGKVDILIGTHRLLQKDVKFRDLGLLVLDEEHRFGVKHKEALKKIRTEVDVLTLSATPIPRTLQMSLLGLRDLTTISTPPQDRHAIETYVVPFDPEIIRRALIYEIGRSGQAFVVHNRVSDIESVAERIKAIVPEARIAVGHGQMAEKGLERVMLEFVAGRYDILVCTTIIESGLDIPNANTLIVNRADRFGLAQLYQLRGRVGRSERQAYTYLIVPDEETLSGDARKRLEALYDFSELGSGFRIARYDLEIRGAGNLLGTSQSGQIRAVGYDLYMEYLTRAIRELKGEDVVEEVDPEIHFEMPAYLPQPYIDDSAQRLSFYKRLASAPDHEEIERIRGEMQDRYGPPPSEAMTLFNLIEIKVRLRRLKVREARLAEEGLLLAFAPHTPVSVSRILEWAAHEPDRLRLYPDDRLLVRFSVQDMQERLQNIERILTWLEERSDAGR